MVDEHDDWQVWCAPCGVRGYHHKRNTPCLDAVVARFRTERSQAQPYSDHGDAGALDSADIVRARLETLVGPLDDDAIELDAPASERLAEALADESGPTPAMLALFREHVAARDWVRGPLGIGPIGLDAAHEAWEQERAARIKADAIVVLAAAYVATLPKCDKCPAIAMHRGPTGCAWCDVHVPLRYRNERDAAPLRALVVAIAEGGSR